MSTDPRWNRRSGGSFRAKPGHRLEEARYWGVRSTLERMDGRLAREEYYTRLSSSTLAQEQRGF